MSLAFAGLNNNRPMFTFNEYLFFIASYLLGSIPFGIIVAKLYGVKDITQHGSGNIGATNVVRVSGKKAGALCFMLDFCKGLIPVLLYMHYFGINEGRFIVALLVVIGHILPVFNRFRGGKGVATGFGVLMAISPFLGFSAILLWVACFLTTRISSASALFSYSFMPFFLLPITDNVYAMIFAVILSLIIYIRHIDNIKRLLKGKEKPFAK